MFLGWEPHVLGSNSVKPINQQTGWVYRCAWVTSGVPQNEWCKTYLYSRTYIWVWGNIQNLRNRRFGPFLSILGSTIKVLWYPVSTHAHKKVTSYHLAGIKRGPKQSHDISPSASWRDQICGFDFEYTSFETLVGCISHWLILTSYCEITGINHQTIDINH